MDEMVTGDLGSQNSNDGGANGSSLIATTILHPMVQDLAFSATNYNLIGIFQKLNTHGYTMTKSGSMASLRDRMQKSVLSLD
jgi:hypothetical protein